MQQTHAAFLPKLLEGLSVDFAVSRTDIGHFSADKIMDDAVPANLDDITNS